MVTRKLRKQFFLFFLGFFVDFVVTVGMFINGNDRMEAIQEVLGQIKKRQEDTLTSSSTFYKEFSKNFP